MDRHGLIALSSGCDPGAERRIEPCAAADAGSARACRSSGRTDPRLRHADADLYGPSVTLNGGRAVALSTEAGPAFCQEVAGRDDGGVRRESDQRARAGCQPAL